MSKIKIALTTYSTSKKLIDEQIKKEEKYIEDYSEMLEERMQEKLTRLILKAYGHERTIDYYQEVIAESKNNIEKLKKGDIEFLFELMSKEEKRKQAPLNSLIVELLDILEQQVELKQQPTIHKPGSMSIDDFTESCDKSIKELKKNITRLLEGDIDLYNKLDQAMYKRRYTD